MMALRSMTWRPALAADAVTLPSGGSSEYPADLLLWFDAELRPHRPLQQYVSFCLGQYAVSTINDYSREIARFETFLTKRYGQHLFDSIVVENGDEALRKYARSRTDPDGEDGTVVVGATREAIGKARAAVFSFYQFAVAMGWLRAFPFTLIKKHTRKGTVETLAFLQGGRLTESAGRPILAAQLDRFLRVGLLGKLPSGAPDPGFQAYNTIQRNAAAMGLGVGIGLRHKELLLTTVFEVPSPHPDGFTPVHVAGTIAKRGRSRKVVALSDWMLPIKQYIRGDRHLIQRRATWKPSKPLEIDLAATDSTAAGVVGGLGKVMLVPWKQLDREDRMRLVMPGGGSALVLLDHKSRSGAPLLSKDVIGDATRSARERCHTFWPEEMWDYTVHSYRHAFGHTLLNRLENREGLSRKFEADHGRKPAWHFLVERNDPLRIVQDSMGHQSFETTLKYTEDAFWSLLASVSANPEHNPALRGDLE
jgi:integrase